MFEKLDWNDLRYFLAIAENGSLSAAAKRLKASQPTLSRRLTALEEDIGCDLFARTRAGLELTATGERLVDHVRHMRDDVHAIERIVTGDDSRLKGSVIVSAPGMLASYWLVSKLAPLKEQYPGIAIDVREDLEVVDLTRREADIAFRLFRPQQLDLYARRIGCAVNAFFASKDYLKRRGAPERLDDLRHHDIILPSGELMPLAEETIYSLMPIKDRIVMRANTSFALYQAVKSGLGIACLMSGHADLDPDLRRILPDYAVLENDIWLVAHSELKRSARIRVVFDYLAECLNEDRHILRGGAPEHVLIAGIRHKTAQGVA